MARLLILTTHPTRDAGEVVDVFEDGRELQGLALRQFAVVDLPGVSVEDARAKWMESGVPAELRAACDAADAELRAAVLRGDKAEIDQAHANVVAAQAVAEPARWPRRARLFDVAQIPRKCRDDVAANWAALSAAAADAKAAAKVAVVAEIERREGRTLTQTEKDVPTIERLEKLARDHEAAKARGADKRTLGRIDEYGDALKAASRAGRKAIEDAALAAVPIPEPVTLDPKTLDAAEAVDVRR